MTQPIKNREPLEPWLNTEEDYNPMSHAEALELNAVELYVLHKLSPEQDRRFEEHYFECAECAGAVAVEQALAENASVPRPKPRPWWQRFTLPLLAPAAASLLALCGYQYSEISRLLAPQASTTIVATEGELMGGAEDSQPVKTEFVTIELFDLPHDKPEFYRVKIISLGKDTHSFNVPAPQGNSSRESIQVPSSTLHSGPNVLVLSSPDGDVVKQYKFTVKR